MDYLNLINVTLPLVILNETYYSLLCVQNNLCKIKNSYLRDLTNTKKSKLYTSSIGTNKVILKKSEFSYNEYIIGTFVCNRIRYNIPNFIYCYGLYNKFLVYEYIDGITLYNYIKCCNLAEFKNIFLQIIFSLDYAYEKYKFTHYDMQLSNIIIKRMDSQIHVNYRLGNINITDLAVIIDFDCSYAEIYNKKSSRYKTHCAFFDIYMLIKSCMLEGNGDIYKYLTKISEFIKIVEENITVRYIDINYYFDIPIYTKTLAKVTYENFIEFMYNRFLL